MENEDSLIIAIIHLDSSIERKDGIISPFDQPKTGLKN
jgi:hypothetical protein